MHCTHAQTQQHRGQRIEFYHSAHGTMYILYVPSMKLCIYYVYHKCTRNKSRLFDEGFVEFTALIVMIASLKTNEV